MNGVNHPMLCSGTHPFVPLATVRHCPPLDDMQWFHCPHERVTYVGGSVGSGQSVQERDTAELAHAALCPSRPAGRDRTDEEAAAVERWHGPPLRARLHRLAVQESTLLRHLGGSHTEPNQANQLRQELDQVRNDRHNLLALMRRLGLPVLPPGTTHAR